MVDDPGERLLELSVELDRTARDGRESVARLADELRAEAAARAAAAGVELHAAPDETTALRARVEELEVEAARARTDAERAAAAWRNEVGSLAARIDELLGLRHADAQAARAASTHLGERLEELAALRPDDDRATPGSEAGPELRAELEQMASSVEQLGRRLDEQVAVGEEQVRATERAVRKGLASLGKQLIDPEAKGALEGRVSGARSSGLAPRWSGATHGWPTRIQCLQRRGGGVRTDADGISPRGDSRVAARSSERQSGSRAARACSSSPATGARHSRSIVGRARSSTASEARQDRRVPDSARTCLLSRSTAR